MSKININKQQALDYHSFGRPGKIQVLPTKPTQNQRDLSLAYSPGVAEPCLAIAQNPDDVYKYTAKGNLVGVISNGTAVLGLGNIGPEASKPVMEGKSVLFKIFADIDAFDIELNCTSADAVVATVKALEPTFGGINLEDIKSPECFEIEERLRQELNIPIMHDDQHGTAIISSAALLNALELVNKPIQNCQFAIAGAGAAAISCAKLYLSLGAKLENMLMFDVEGLISNKRTNLNKYVQMFASNREGISSLADAMKGADVFLGLSVGNIVSKEMIESMAENPIVFAMANPNPEISYEDATSVREDIIMATGRSDYPNQVNNVLGFPYIFRGALDVMATDIDDNMKLAAAKALAQLAKTAVPEVVNMAYNTNNLVFGRNYIIPKPLDPRLITTVAPAVAKAAMASGLAKKHITDWNAYEIELSKRLGLDNKLMQYVINKAQKTPQKIVFADAENLKVLKAVQQAKDENICVPILLGDKNTISTLISVNQLDLQDVTIIDVRSPEENQRLEKYTLLYYEKRKRKGLNLAEARRQMQVRNYFAAMMVETGDADGMIGGLSRNYPDTIRPALQIIGKQTQAQKVAGMYILLTKNGPIFFADTTINFNPTVDEMVEITELTYQAVENFNIKPQIALLTYSNFGSALGEDALKMKEATAVLQKKHPEWIVEGEMQAHLAFDTALNKEYFPFSKFAETGANTLIFPNLSSANIAYNLLKEASEIEYIGPILLGLKKPVHILQMGASVKEIFNMIAIAAAKI